MIIPDLLIAWIPFRQPMPGIQDHWLWLLPVLVLGIAMMYKAIRTVDLAQWPRDVLIMTGQVLLAFSGLAIGLFLLVQVVVPFLPSS
tara:strand:- start:300 stop:560 length:261 start_codon:yes stop_codon:yes gene_type:complete